MDDVKVGHPTPVITPSHSSNEVSPTPSDYTPISILTAVLAHQVKVVDDFGNIPIIVGFHNKFNLKNVLSHPPNLTQIL